MDGKAWNPISIGVDLFNKNIDFRYFAKTIRSDLSCLILLIVRSLLFQVRLGVREWWFGVVESLATINNHDSCEYFVVVTKLPQSTVSHLSLDAWTLIPFV